MKNYNIHTAMDLRVNGIYDDVKGFQIPIDFKTSVDLAKDDQFVWGWNYPGEVVMQVMNARSRGEAITKATYKMWSRQYRLYIREYNHANLY